MSGSVRGSNSILLGASNLTLAWPRIMRELELRLPAERTVLTAHGMGRSYLAEKCRFGFRQLPGILQSALWQQLADLPVDRPSFALITDLGNDLVFGSASSAVANAAEECVQRVRNWNPAAQIVMTRPPLAAVSGLGRLRYGFFRRLLFPRCRMTLEEIKEGVRQLDTRVRQLATDQNLVLLEPRLEWYGLDPIHVLRQHQRAAFGSMMDLWGLARSGEQATAAKWPRPLAHTRWKFGRELTMEQPVHRSGGTTVYAY